MCLGVKPGIGQKHIAERHGQIGNIILLKLVKRKRFASNAIIQELSNHIVTGHNAPQHIGKLIKLIFPINYSNYSINFLTKECLYNMTRNLKHIMLENQGTISQLVQELSQIPGEHAKLIIEAILPLITISPMIRDNLILILRKALWGKTVETRGMSVTGFLKILKNLRVSNLNSWSQSGGSSSSTHSLMTQLSLDCQSSQAGRSQINNEALCLEVLQILRRCFILQCEVRSEFYAGLYEAVCTNGELGVSSLDLLWMHFTSFYVLDKVDLPPIDFSKICATKGIDVVLQVQFI